MLRASGRDDRGGAVLGTSGRDDRGGAVLRTSGRDDGDEKARTIS